MIEFLVQAKKQRDWFLVADGRFREQKDWFLVADGRFRAGDIGDGSEAAAQAAAVSRAQAITGYDEVKVLRVETSAVWPVTEYRTREIPARQLK